MLKKPRLLKKKPPKRKNNPAEEKHDGAMNTIAPPFSVLLFCRGMIPGRKDVCCMEPEEKTAVLTLNGCRMRLYGDNSRAGTVLWLIGEDEVPRLEGLPQDAAVITVSGMDWDRDLSPWPAPPAFRGRPFSGGAGDFVRRLTEEQMPLALEGFSLHPAKEGILGYSLAGLFSLYALCCSDRFTLAASVSGSLWYDGFLSWLEAHPPVRRPERLYFSVGDREKKSRSARLAAVEDCTRRAAEWALQYCDETVFRLETGGHFDGPEERVQRALMFLATSGQCSANSSQSK